jgi:hypothetical protein
VREPRAPVALVHAEALETSLYPCCERGRATGWIGEHEHAHRTRLAVSGDLEEERVGGRGLAPEQVDDRIEGDARLRAEKRDRDVVRIGVTTPLHMAGGPPCELAGDLVRELEREEESDPAIPLDGSGWAHAFV